MVFSHHFDWMSTVYPMHYRPVDQPVNSPRTNRQTRGIWLVRRCPCTNHVCHHRPMDIPTPMPVRFLRIETDAAVPSAVSECHRKILMWLLERGKFIECIARFTSTRMHLLCTPSRLQLRILPVIMSPFRGRKTMYRKMTSVCDAPSPGRMIESPMWMISFKAMHRPTFSRTWKLYQKRVQICDRDPFQWHFTLFASFLLISSLTASINFKLNISGGIRIVSLSSADMNILDVQLITNRNRT